jgi:hypothetical protein
VAKVEVFFSDETFWLGQRSMVELYGVDRLVITKHIGNIFKSKELHEDSVCAKIAHTAQDGKTYTSQFYKLDTFLQFNEYDILNDSGKVSHEIAIQLAK